MPIIEIGSSRIPYTVVRGSSRHYTYFRFKPDSTLEVVLPRGRPVDIERAIRSRGSWVRREHERMKRTQQILSQDYAMFDGNHLRVTFVEDPRESLIPDTERGEVVVRSSERRRVRELVRRWYLRESSAYVVKKVREGASVLGVNPSKVDVREIDKWGYCTRSGRLSFSWQLIALPEKLREYVVLHELVHLVEFNHGQRFKRKLAQVCPDFRIRERDLDLILPYDRMSLE